MVRSMVNEYVPDYVSPPGDTLAEILGSIGMSQTELAKRMGRPIKTVNEIVNGKAAITPETALQLEKVLRVPARFWNNRERLYREFLAKRSERDKLSEDLRWLKEIPVHEMIKKGWIERGADNVEQLSIVLQFFGVAGVEQWKQIWTEPLVAYRESAVFKSRLGALSAWLRKGEIEAQKIACSSYKKTLFKKSLSQIRELTREPFPEKFIPQLINDCAKAGVAVVFIPELKGLAASGATYWLTSHKAVIQLDLRYKTNDHLWFTFFHEAGHIILHEKCLIIEGLDGKEDLEQEANKFSKDFLIDDKKYQDFITRHKRFSRVGVQTFAQEVGIAPGIVVGRLQHDKYLPFSHLNDLKVVYAWK